MADGEWKQALEASLFADVKPKPLRRVRGHVNGYPGFEWEAVEWPGEKQAPLGWLRKQPGVKKMQIGILSVFAAAAPQNCVTGSCPGDGTIVAHMTTEGMALPEAEQLISAWKAAVRDQTSGRPSEPQLTKDEYLRVWRELRPKYKQRGLVSALASALCVHRDTINRWHNQYGWPLYDEVNKSDISTA